MGIQIQVPTSYRNTRVLSRANSLSTSRVYSCLSVNLRLSGGSRSVGPQPIPELPLPSAGSGTGRSEQSPGTWCCDPRGRSLGSTAGPGAPPCEDAPGGRCGAGITRLGEPLQKPSSKSLEQREPGLG